MTNEQLVELCQNGNKQALDDLINQNTGIVYKIVNKYYTEKTSSIDKDDLIQEGFMGIMIAVDKYDISHVKAAKFITYAVFWIEQKITRFINQKNTNYEVSLNIPISHEEGSAELMDTLPDKINEFIEAERSIYNQALRCELEEVMSQYNTLLEREIIKLKYGWNGNIGMTDNEVGELFTLTKHQVSDIRNRALRKIRQTPWGARMARELYGEKFNRSYNNIDNLIDRMDFARKYMMD